MPTLDQITAAVKAMRAKFDPSQLTAAAGDQTLGNWQYGDTLNGLMKNSIGMNVQAEQQAQLAKNSLASQITDLSRQYGTDRRNLTNDFADRGMLYSGGHIGKQADLGGNFVSQTGQAEQGTSDFLSNLKQKLADAQVATEEQKRQADMQKLQTDQAYALAQAQTDSYTQALNAANNPAPATPAASPTPQSAATTTIPDGGNVPGNTHSQGWGQAPSGQWQQALQRFQQRRQQMSPRSQGTSPSPNTPSSPMPQAPTPMAQPQPAMSPATAGGVPSPMAGSAGPTPSSPQSQFMAQTPVSYEHTNLPSAPQIGGMAPISYEHNLPPQGPDMAMPAQTMANPPQQQAGIDPGMLMALQRKLSMSPQQGY